MNGVKKVQILDGTTLKIIAMISMVFDHVGDMFFPGVMWPRMIGRLAMPIFSFFIAEGFAHTRDKKKYLGRLGLFALISEIPFDLAFDGRLGLGHQNIMLTFFLAGLALMLFDRIRGGNGPEGERIPVGLRGRRRVSVLRTPAEASAAPERRGRGISGAHEDDGLLCCDRLQLYPPCPV